MTFARLLLCYATLLTASAVSARPLHVDSIDAERLAGLIRTHGIALAPELIERAYLQRGTEALRSMSPHYIPSADDLAQVIAKHQALYQHAASTCLPWLSRIAPALSGVTQRYGVMFPGRDPPPITVIFGANNSAGTVIQGRVIISLEKVCEGTKDAATFEQKAVALIAHEWIHTLQPELADDDRRDLLVWAMREGTANVLAADVVAGQSNAQDLFWAIEREGELWREFQADRATLLAHWPKGGAPDATGQAAGMRWFWNSASPGGRPADLGYWVGERIAAKWLSRQTDRARGARVLINARSYEEILKSSGYAPAIPGGRQKVIQRDCPVETTEQPSSCDAPATPEGAARTQSST